MEALGNNFVIIDAVTQDFNFDKKLIKKLVNSNEYLVFE
jgi:diaminopimelate epimerase